MTSPVDNPPGSAALRRGGSVSRPASERPSSDRTQLLLEVATRQERVEGQLKGVETAVGNARDDTLREMGEVRADVRANSDGIAALTAAQALLTATVEQSIAVSHQVLQTEQQRRQEEQEMRRRQEARDQRAEERDEARRREELQAKQEADERRAQWWVRLWDVVKGPLALILATAAGVVGVLIQQGC